MRLRIKASHNNEREGLVPVALPLAGLVVAGRTIVRVHLGVLADHHVG